MLMQSPRYRENKLDLLLDLESLEQFAQSTTDLNIQSVIQGIPQPSFDNVDRNLKIARKTPDQDLRLKSITQALQILRPFRDQGVYALPPYPFILHELYLYYIDRESFATALSILLFMHLNCHAYSYPQPNNVLNIERLYAMAKLCVTILSSLHDAREPGSIDGIGNASSYFPLT